MRYTISYYGQNVTSSKSPRMMDLRETTWSRGSHLLRGRHWHYLLAHLLRNNHTTIRVNGAQAIMMITSLPIHLSNHSPQALERNLSGRCNHQRRNENDQQRKRQRQRQMSMDHVHCVYDIYILEYTYIQVQIRIGAYTG
jgi:hypothetical protein